jgi:thiamine kinase
VAQLETTLPGSNTVSVTSEELLQQHALEDFRAWTTKQPINTQPRIAGKLSRGSGHTTILVAADNAAGNKFFVLRYRTHPSTPLGLSFGQETACMQLAYEQGLAPQVVWQDIDQQSMVMEFLNESGSVSCEELANLAKSIHRLPPVTPPLNLQHQLEHYWQIARDRGNTASVLVNPKEPALGAAIKALEFEVPVTCHNDLTPPNIRRRNRTIVAIDWEYAATGSPHFDVATLCAGWPAMNRQALALAILGDQLSPPLFDIATYFYKALSWNWHRAAGEKIKNNQAPTSILQRLAASL